MRVSLTDLACRKARPDPERRVDLWDSVVPGLSLRITPAGGKSWTVVARLRRKPVRVTLGVFPALSVKVARAKAREALEALHEGRRPFATRTTPNVEAAFEDFITSRVGKVSPAHVVNLRSALRTYITPAIGRIPVTEIRRRDLVDLLAGIAKTYGPRANSVRTYLGGFFAWMIEREMIDASPIAGVRSPAPAKSRERVYTDPELRMIWRATETAMGWPYGPFVRFLLVTAQRRGQALAMKWTDVDLDRNVWTSRTKEDRLHPVPLSELAREILDGAQKFDDGPFVFAVEGKRPITNLGVLASRIRDFGEGAPADFRLHDLRRTAATRMAELGVKPWVIDAILDHAAGGVTAIYQRYGYLEEMRHGLGLWSSRVREILAAT